jgi:hypothetical protein
MNTPSNELHIFQVAADDIGILWRTCCGWHPPLSPIGPDLKEYAPGSGQVTPELQKIAAQPQAVKAAAMLAQPDLRLHCWMGGATTSLSYAVFCRSRAVDPDGVAVFAPSYQGSLLVNYFPSVAMGATWGADVLGSDVTGEPPLLLPPVMRWNLPSMLFTPSTASAGGISVHAGACHPGDTPPDRPAVHRGVLTSRWLPPTSAGCCPPSCK